MLLNYKYFFSSPLRYLLLFSIVFIQNVCVSQVKQIFNFTGADQILTIPPCVNQIKIKMWGAGGGGSKYLLENAGGGAGGYAEGFLNVTPGDQFSLVVGEGGGCDGDVAVTAYGFGGKYNAINYGGWGGGLSGIFTGTTTVLHTDQPRALLVAGGGGGGEKDAPGTYCTSGGQGGDAIFGGGMPTMRGENGTPKVGPGGGGGYHGGTMTLRLSGNGIYHGGEGGTNYVSPSIISGVSLNSPDFGTWNVYPSLFKNPPNIADPDYTAFVDEFAPGVGVGSMYTFRKSGHGRIVIEFIALAGPTITVNSSTICLGQQTATINASGANSYTWSAGLSSTTGSIVTGNPSSSQTYTITGVDLNGCINSTTFSISVKPLPILVVNSPTICLGYTGTINVSGASTYTWSDGTHGSSQTISPSTSSVYTITGTDAFGCFSTINSNVTVLNPIANYTGNNNLNYTRNEILDLINTSTNASNYEWEFCNGSFSTNTNVSLPLLDTGICCVKLIAINNMCRDSTTKCFRVIPETFIRIPNVFSPNGDNANEVFKINSSGLKSLNCTIFDRWGLKLYEWEGLNGYWDGKAKTGLAPSGTYFYIINYSDFENNEKTEKGFLTLFKD